MIRPKMPHMLRVSSQRLRSPQVGHVIKTHQPEDFTELWRVFCIVPCYYSRDRAVSPNYSLYRVVRRPINQRQHQHRRPINQRQPNTTIRPTPRFFTVGLRSPGVAR